MPLIDSIIEEQTQGQAFKGKKKSKKSKGAYYKGERFGKGQYKKLKFKLGSGLYT